MDRIKKLEVSNTRYLKILDTQFKNGSDVREQTIGGRVKMFSDNMLIATFCKSASLDVKDLSSGQFYSFLGHFNKQLYSQFLKNPNLFDLEVEFSGVSRMKNMGQWNKVKLGEYFYNVDISSAYWQCANKLGYLNDNMFKKYMFSDAHKGVKRYCISFLSRRNQMKYFRKDLKTGLLSTQVIVCDPEFMDKIYLNIRHYLYSIIAGAREEIKDKFLEYNIDGITVGKNQIDKVKDYFKSNGFYFKITECKKLSEDSYKYGKIIRKFKVIKKIKYHEQQTK